MNIKLIYLAFSIVLMGCGGGSSSPTKPISVADTTPPIITPPNAINVIATDTYGIAASDDAIAAFLVAGSASDNVDSIVTVNNNAPNIFPLGITTVTFSASDIAGNEANDVTSTVTVALEADSDGDGVFDSLDDFPNDATETTDTDADGVGDNTDDFPNDATETTDTDADSVGDNTDDFPNDATETTDTDADGVGDNADSFPNDATETTDTDGDGVGNNADSFPNDATETTDTDGDGAGNNTDPDSDNDGVSNRLDDFPFDATEITDTDGDGIGNNTDPDDDNDGVIDANDEFPLDSGNVVDTDGDGILDRDDVFPYDSSLFKALRVSLAETQSLSLSGALDTNNVSSSPAAPKQLKISKALLPSNFYLPKARAKTSFEALSNIIARNDDGAIELGAVLSSETTFIAEANITPDGQFLYLLTSAHIQRAIPELDEEICSVYRVVLEDMSFSCILSKEDGDIEPKLLGGGLQTDFARSGIAFRTDGAAVLKGFNWNRILPEGVSGGTNSTIAWFLNPMGELIPIPIDDDRFVIGVYWLTDDYFAVGEQPVNYSDSAAPGNPRLAIYDANDLSRVKTVDAENIWSQTVKLGSDLHWIYGGSFNGQTLELQPALVQGVPYTDITGTRLFGLIDYAGIDNRFESVDGDIVLALSDGVAQSNYNWRKGSGTGTDIGYSIIAFSERHIAYMKNFAANTPIISIDGVAQNQEFTQGSREITLTNDRGLLQIDGDQWFFSLNASFAGDLILDYSVQKAASEEKRQLTITAQTIENWRNDSARPTIESGTRIQDAGLKWASPEPEQEGFCVYQYDTQLSKCHKFEDYQVVTTDLETFRSTRYDDGAVYPNGSGNAYPGVQAIVITGSDVRVFFKDTTDHQYYQAVADLDEFYSTGAPAIGYSSAVNGAGEASIIAGTTSLKPLTALSLTNVTIIESGQQEIEIDFGQSLSAYLLPDFDVWNGNSAVPLATEIEWSDLRDKATINLTAQNLINGSEHEVRILTPIFLKDNTRQYALSQPLLFIPSGANAFKLGGTSVRLTDYNPVTQSYNSNTVAVSASSGAMSIDLRTTPLNQQNMANATTSGDFNTPILSFDLASLPVGVGSAKIEIYLLDGEDNVKSEGERRIYLELNAEWQSDGVNASITLPIQTVSAFYETSGGTRVDLEIDNLDADMLSVSSGGVNYPSSLDLKILSALNKVDFLSPSSLLRPGQFHVKVITNLPMVNNDNTEVTELNVIFQIGQ